MRITLIYLFFSFSFLSFSQNNTHLEGKVLDFVSKAPIEYTQVKLYNAIDSAWITGVYTDEKGYYRFDSIAFGTYYLQYSNFEYETKYSANFQVSETKNSVKIPIAYLSMPEKSLDEVVIERDKTSLQIGIEKKVYQVGDDIANKGGNASDVMNNIPSIEVDQDGTISLRGDANVTILIDGKPSNLSGGNGKSFLDGIPANSIERIEIVSNPSAKYDPDGTSGIINIVLKRNTLRGFNGNVDASAGTGNLYTASAGLSIRNKKINVFGNYAFSYRDGYRNNFTTLEQYYHDTTISLIQNRLGGDLNINHTAKLGMDIYIKERNTFYWNVSGNYSDRTRTGNQENTRMTNIDGIQTKWNRIAKDPEMNQNLDLNLGYKWDFKENKGGIEWSVYESLSKGTENGIYSQTFLIPIDSAAIFQQLFSKQKNNYSTVAMDFTRNIKTNYKFESGLKAINRSMTLQSNSETADSLGTYQSDTLSNYNYSYVEGIYSAYTMFSGQIKQFKFQAGLRFEYSLQNPNLISENQSFKNEYFNIFPSAIVRYEVKKTSEFSLGYSKRINRPSSWNLNPFTSYADPYNLRSGNPALRPEYIHSIDFGYTLTTKKLVVSTALYQRFTNNVIQRVKLYRENGASVGTFANIDKSLSAGGELIIQYKTFPIWRNMLSLNGTYITYLDDNPSVNWNRSGFRFSMKFSSTLELLKKTLTLQINGRYSAPSVTAQGTMQPRGAIDFSVDKSLLNNKWGIGFRITDIFNTQGFIFDVDQPNLTQHNEFKWETRRFIVNVRYRFGKTEMKSEKKLNDSEGGGGMDF